MYNFRNQKLLLIILTNLILCFIYSVVELSDSSLSVRVKSHTSRHRRATEPTHKLVDDNG